MSDTGTDWAATADALEARANFVDPYALLSDEDLDNMRAAAVGLRRLAQLEHAVRMHRAAAMELASVATFTAGTVTVTNNVADRTLWAAVLGSGEQPEGPTTCPTCRRPKYPNASPWCPDSWHGGQE